MARIIETVTEPVTSISDVVVPIIELGPNELHTYKRDKTM